jgi:hypothetical protein
MKYLILILILFSSSVHAKDCAELEVELHYAVWNDLSIDWHLFAEYGAEYVCAESDNVLIQGMCAELEYCEQN